MPTSTSTAQLPGVPTRTDGPAGATTTRALPAAAADAHGSPPAVRPRPAGALPGWTEVLAGLLAVTAAGAGPLVAFFRAADAGVSAPAPSGVTAALAAAAQRAWRWDLLRGLPTGRRPHEIGPALAYLMAPFVRSQPHHPLAAEAAAAALLAATVTVAGTAVTWRRIGLLPALWLAVVTDAWVLTLGAPILRDAAPGAVVVIPLLALVVLATAALVGTRGAWLWAAVLGTLVAQSRLPAAPLAAGVVVVGGIAAMVAAGGDDRLEVPAQWWRSPARLLGLATLLLLWVPPLVDLLVDRPANAGLLWQRLRAGHTHLGILAATRRVLAGATLLPLGLDHRALRPGPAAVAGGAACLTVLAAGGWWLARRRYCRPARGVIGFAALGFLLAVLTVRRAPEPVTLRADGWLAWIPAALVLAIGVALLAPLGDAPAGAVGIRAVLVKVRKVTTKFVKERITEHTVRSGLVLRDREEDEAHTSSGKAGEAGKKHDKLARKRAAKAAAAARKRAAGSSRAGPLRWDRPAVWLLVPFAAAALTAGALLVGAASSGPGVAPPTPGVPTAPPSAP